MNNDIDIITDEVLLNHIIDNINNKTPSSFVRKGDGENIVVGFQKINSITHKDFKRMMRIMNVGRYNLNFQQYIKNELLDSLLNCDFLGIAMSNQRYKKWAIEDEILERCNLNTKNYCNMNFHINFVKDPDSKLIKNSLVNKIISNKNIGIISCFNVKDVIQKHGSKLVKWIKVPKQRSFLKKFNKEFYDHIIFDIKDYNTKVDFWLVASGIHGKIFCNVIKKNSGIAIDIGSSIDSWVDKYNSRGYLKKIKKKSSL
tara:strand:+ start:1410 stop:2180 length:771 start_codon:yes stop_codon:yes gene_type:complete